MSPLIHGKAIFAVRDREIREDFLAEPGQVGRAGVSAGERAAVLAVPPAALVAAARVLTLAAHRLAVARDRAAADRYAGHEARHVVVGALTGDEPTRAELEYSDREFPVVCGGRVVFASTIGAATAAAGGVEGGTMSPRDAELVRQALGASYSLDTARDAERTAGLYVRRHAVTVAAVAAALLDAGRVEGDALAAILAPCRPR